MRLILFCLFIPSLCLAQQPINAEQFFLRGLEKEAPADQVMDQKISFPWIDEVEVRTETDEFDFDRQEYLLRLSPSTAGIRKAQKSLYQELKNAPDIEGQEIYCDRVLALHVDWLTLYILRERENKLEEQAAILRDKQTIYERMAGTLEFDPKKLLNLQTEKSDMQLAQNKLRLEWAYILNKYDLQGQEIAFGEFATVETIAAFLEDSLLSDQSGFTWVDVETEHKKQLVMKEIALEASEKKRLLDFVQFKYNGPHTDAIQERFTVGLGVQLSNSGNRKLKMQELYIEKDELVRKAEREQKEKMENIQQLESELLGGIQSFYFFQKTMEEEQINLQKLSSNIAQREGVSPLLLLEIKERQLSMQLKSLNKQEDLLRDYLKYLQEREVLCQAGFVNYLQR
ncbi:MAG: hypothetical protein AAFR61_03250 [Bacteroidota bacterium]